MTKLKTKMIAAAAALLLGLTAAACGPSPEEVCEKQLVLAKAAVGEKLALEAIGGGLQRCIKSEQRRQEFQGMFKYKKNNACLMEAESYADLKKCK